MVVDPDSLAERSETTQRVEEDSPKDCKGTSKAQRVCGTNDTLREHREGEPEGYETKAVEGNPKKALQDVREAKEGSQ